MGGGEEHHNHINNNSNRAMKSSRSSSSTPYRRNVVVAEVVSCGCSSPLRNSSRRGAAGRGEVSKIWPLFRNDHHLNLLLKHRSLKHSADTRGVAFRTKKPNSEAAATIFKLPPPPPPSSSFFQSSHPCRRPSFNSHSSQIKGNRRLVSQQSSVSSNPEANSVTRADDHDQSSVNTLIHARKKPAVHHHLQLRDALCKEELADALEREFKKAGYLCNSRPKPNQTSSNHHYSFFGDEDAVVETVREEDWRDNYTTIDSSRIQYSSLAQYCTIIGSDHELQADDCSRAELEAVAHSAYSALKNLSRCLIATHCKRMKKKNNTKHKSDDDAVEEILGRLMPDAEFASPSDFKHGIEAYLHRIVLEDFNTESYGVHLQDRFPNPSLRKASFLREFRLFEIHSAEKLVNAECEEFNSSFQSFCLKKRGAINAEIIDHPRGEDAMVAGILSSESYQWPLKLLRVFLDAMRQVWMMHRLSFAMDPPAKIFRPFDDCNMENLQIQFRKNTLLDDCLDKTELCAPKPYHCKKKKKAEFLTHSDDRGSGEASGRKLEFPEDLDNDNYAEKAFVVEEETQFSTHEPYHCIKEARFFSCPEDRRTGEATGRGLEYFEDLDGDDYAEEASVVEKKTIFSTEKPYQCKKMVGFFTLPEDRRKGEFTGRGLEYSEDLDGDDYAEEDSVVEKETNFSTLKPYQCKKKAGFFTYPKGKRTEATRRGLEYSDDLDGNDYAEETSVVEETKLSTQKSYQCKKKAEFFTCSEDRRTGEAARRGLEYSEDLDEDDYGAEEASVVKEDTKFRAQKPPYRCKKKGGLEYPEAPEEHRLCSLIEGIKPLPKFDDKIMEPVHMDDEFTERMQFVVMPGFVLPHGDVLVKSKVYLQPWNGISPSEKNSHFS